MKKNIKRIVVSFLISALVLALLSLAGCSSVIELQGCQTPAMTGASALDKPSKKTKAFARKTKRNHNKFRRASRRGY